MIMSSTELPNNRVKSRRLARGWSQQELADRAGLSRAGVSAIESGRLAPSVNAALALGRALDATVEALFDVQRGEPAEHEWATPPNRSPVRYWKARVGDRVWSYPVGEDGLQLDWHDGIYDDGAFHDRGDAAADHTLVLAGCDPAAGLLAAEYARQFQFRMIVLRRSSTAALELLVAGKVHAAGIHLGRSGAKSDNSHVAHLRLGADCELVRVAAWEEGLAIGSRLTSSTIRGLVRAKAHWVGREEGSGARQCQDEILGSRPAPRRIAYDHRSVAAAIKCGWADVGPCVRLASEEAGLQFIKVSQRDYDICFRREAEDDPRISALLATLRSTRYRARLAELPGYYTTHTGELFS